MLSNDLAALRLTPNQIKVYEYVLDNSPIKASAIINHLGVNRAVVYKTLDELIQKKLISKVIKNSVAQYIPLEPFALEDSLKKQQIATQEAVKKIKEKISEHKSPKTDFFVFNGVDGIIEFFNFLVSIGEDWYIIGANFGMHKQEEYRREIPNLQAKITKAGFKTYIIADKNTKNMNWIGNSEIIFFGDQVHPSSTVIQIFGDYVAHVLWQKPEFVFVFKNKQVADDYRKYYSLLSNHVSK